MIEDIFTKIGRNSGLTQSEIEELRMFMGANHNTTAKLTNIKTLDEITYDLGDMIAGRFISPADPNDNNPDSSTFTGTYQSSAGIVGKNAGTTQFQLNSSDGKATAGEGQVVLDGNGVSVLVSDTFHDENSYKFIDGDGAPVGYLNCEGDSTYKVVSVQAKKVDGQSSAIFIKSDCPTSKTSGIELFADYNSAGTTPARIYLYNNGTPTAEIRASTIKFIGTPSGDIEAGVYTPTLTNTTNISASTAYECQYMRVGKVVNVSGQVDIDPTAAGACILTMSIPVASTFTANGQLGGTAESNAELPCRIRASTSTYSAVFQFAATASTLGNQIFYFIFSYRVV